MAKLNQESISKMRQLLSSWVVFYQKVHTYHWDLVGNQFLEFHKHLQTLYEDSVAHTDSIAERLRQLGEKTKLTLNGASSDSAVIDSNNYETMPEICSDLIQGIAQLTVLQNDIFNESTEQGDYVTADLMTQLSRWAEFNSWFLASLVGKENISNI